MLYILRPWCYIGQANLGAAINELAVDHPGITVEVTWKPFLLRPNMPEDGTPKAPDTPGNPRVGARLKQAGAAAGVNFTGLTDRSPNSVKAHTLTKFFEEDPRLRPLQDAFVKVVFRHYFTDGKYPDTANLTAAAAEVGLGGADLEAAAAFMEDREQQAAVTQEALGYSRSGVNGVPYFIFAAANGSGQGFSGAQPPAVLKQAILATVEE